MPHRHVQSEAAWVRLFVPVSPSRARLWVLGLLLAGWICSLLAMYCLTVAHRPAGGDSPRQGYGVAGGASMIAALCDESICATFFPAI
jgi:hypothetical protein